MAKPKKPGLLLIGVGQILTSVIVAGFLLGYLVDVYFETRPIFLLLFGALGFVGGFMKVYRLLNDPGLR